MSDTNGIDWREELRKIEREYDGLPPEASRTQIRLQKIQEIVARSRLEERLAAVGVWVRLALVGALATSLYWWPYGHACGFSLGAFLGSQAIVMIGGLLVARLTWRSRQALPFCGAALFILAAWTVIALQTLPRLGLGLGLPPRANSAWVCTD